MSIAWGVEGIEAANNAKIKRLSGRIAALEAEVERLKAPLADRYFIEEIKEKARMEGKIEATAEIARLEAEVKRLKKSYAEAFWKLSSEKNEKAKGAGKREAAEITEALTAENIKLREEIKALTGC